MFQKSSRYVRNRTGEKQSLKEFQWLGREGELSLRALQVSCLINIYHNKINPLYQYRAFSKASRCMWLTCLFLLEQLWKAITHNAAQKERHLSNLAKWKLQAEGIRRSRNKYKGQDSCLPQRIYVQSFKLNQGHYDTNKRKQVGCSGSPL